MPNQLKQALRGARRALTGTAREDQWYEITGYPFPVTFHLTYSILTGVGMGRYGAFHFGPIGQSPSLEGSIGVDQWENLRAERRLRPISAPVAA